MLRQQAPFRQHKNLTRHLLARQTLQIFVFEQLRLISIALASATQSDGPELFSL